MGAVEGTNVGMLPLLVDMSVPAWAVWPVVVTESGAFVPAVSSNFQ
jgi:hypothetical protein